MANTTVPRNNTASAEKYAAQSGEKPGWEKHTATIRTVITMFAPTRNLAPVESGPYGLH